MTDRLHLGRAVARIATTVVWEHLRPRSLAPGGVPARIEDITPEWLTGALGRRVPGAVVTGVELGAGSSGTSVRRQIRLTYNQVGAAGGLPATVFAKSTPTILTRIANGVTGTSATEAGFYTHLRPGLELEAPTGWFSAFDRRSCRSIHLLEDLTETRAATFCTPTTEIDRGEARQLVDQLAALHRSEACRRIAADGPPVWMRTYAGWWEAGMRVANLERHHAKGFAQSASVVPGALRSDSASLWAAFRRSIADHDDGPATVIHNDVHLGNWYRTGAGRMGLCDWQCVCVGIGARDLAYAVATTLAVEDRRGWEDELIDRYATAIDQPVGRVRAQYRAQLPGALMMWTPTLSRPPGLPDMQPKATSLEMIRRIATALADHGY